MSFQYSTAPPLAAARPKPSSENSTARCFLRGLTIGASAVDSGVIEACISMTGLLRRFLGLGVMGRGARAVRREAAAQCAYQRYVENQRPGLELGLGAARRYQRVFRRQDVEIGGERSLVSGADDLVCFRGGGDGCPGGGEFLIEGFATRGCICHFAQRR